MEKNEAKSRAGKIGMAKRWASRYEMLVKLSAKYGKEHQNEFMKWPNKYLEKLLAYVEAGK